MKKTTIILFISIISFNAFSQKTGNLFKTVIFGSSVTYIWDNDNSTNYLTHELTWNVNGAISLNKSVFVGTQVLNILIVKLYRE